MAYQGEVVVTLIPKDVTNTPNMEKIGTEDVEEERNANTSIPVFAVTALKCMFV